MNIMVNGIVKKDMEKESSKKPQQEEPKEYFMIKIK
jgi:hypothetical protein